MTAESDTGPIDTGPIDTVVFDLGGVLIEWDPRPLYRTFGLDDAAIAAFLSETGFFEWNHHLDAGGDWGESVAELSARFPKYAELIAAYPARFAESLVGPVPGTVELLGDVHQRGVRLLALTNWSAVTFVHARRRFAFLDLFESIVVSGEERLAKPDPAIFALLLQRFDLDPGRTLFIDDSTANIESARALGLRTVHFAGAEHLREVLSSLQLMA